MARNPGVLRISANFEPIIQAPLDARQRVGLYTDLVNPATWADPSGNIWIFKGAIAVVSTDPSAGIYWLSDNDYTNYSNWKNAGSIDPQDIQDLYDYIDASLAARDASIVSLYNYIYTIDSSIERIDSSINALFSKQDTSVFGAINIGDGSVGIFKSIDASGNIQLKTFKGAGAAVVSEVSDTVIISLDASFAGEINYGENVGSGDASVYYQKSGDALQFRELKGGTGITLSVSDNIIVIDASGGSSPSGPSIDGGVWITDITPQSAGNVGDKVYSSDGAVLDSCLTDTSLLIVAVLALPGHTNYKPYIYINNVSVNISALPDKPVFTGTYNMAYNFADASITVVHEDGAQWSTIVDADTPAVIQSAVFIGGYPGTQTELKAGDVFDVSIMTDVPIVSVEVDNYGAFTAGTFTVSGNNVRITGTIADRGDFTQDLGFKLRVVKSTGSKSSYYLSETHGIVDGTHLVKLNDIYPTITWGSIVYPGSQQAIKSAESATIANTVTQYDTLTYSSPNGELTVTSPTTYQSPKTVTYLSGGYNIATNNLRIVANRAANNATSTSNTVIWIANTPVTLSVGGYSSRLRSGGNDGTTAQSHTITITASQRLLSAPDLTKDTGGTWLGAGFSWSASATAFTRSLQVHDNDTKGTYNWGAISGTNLAGIVTSTNSGSTQYILGGFVVRTISVAAFGWQSNINVAVSDYSKLSSSGSGQVLAWSVSNMNTRSTLGDVTRPQASVWSASATGTNPTTINILDKSATDSASQASSFTIQEAI